MISKGDNSKKLWQNKSNWLNISDRVELLTLLFIFGKAITLMQLSVSKE